MKRTPSRPRQSAKEKQGYIIGPLIKALDVLKCVGQLPEAMSLKEIAVRVNLPKTTVFRYLRTFEAANMIVHDKVRDIYRIDTRIVGVINLGNAVQQIRETCLPHMHRLQELTGETINLGIIEGSEVIYLEIVEPPRALRFHARVGGRDPVHTTSLGKAMLAFMPPEARAATLPRALRRRTDQSILDQKSLMEELDQVRSRGYAEDNGENETGATAVGAPLFNASGAVGAAISIAAPSFRLSGEQKAAIIPNLISATQRISAELGFDPANFRHPQN